MHPDWSPTARILIEDVYPEIDGGRYPAKRVLGETLEVWADVFRDGHDVLGAAVLYRAPSAGGWSTAPMLPFDNDRWVGRFPLTEIGRWRYTIQAWTDVYASWRADTTKKHDAGQDVALELIEGRALIEAAAERAEGGARRMLAVTLSALSDAPAEAYAILVSDAVAEAMAAAGVHRDATRYCRELELVVDRPIARFAAWYEMFPRSQGRTPDRGSTFDDCIARLPEIRAMGFDVVYFPPIHPIGRIHRKGPDNTLVAGPGDPGSPYAIGAREGGHTAVHPELGGIAAFRRFVAAAREHGIGVALDFAIQAAPDHPWVAEHPEWFQFRPDGTIRYAENPPKKYQDIVNPDFYVADRERLWAALRDVILHWIGEGVTIFRVDNPHTKPVPFWEWLIADVQERHPGTIFLAEAFTRPKMMRALAKAGFTQSYTYFTWRNRKQELTEYLVELTQGPAREYFRPNFFTNTPDILQPFLQTGGRAAFRIRLVLAATLSSLYGIYSGFELCEATAIPGTEDYLHSEKYQFKVWDWDRPGNIKDEIARVNRIRRENPALHELLNLRFAAAHDDAVLCYAKATADHGNCIVVALTLDPSEPREAEIELPLAELGLEPDEPFGVEELLIGSAWRWQGARHRLRFDPDVNPAMILRLSGE